MRPHKHLSRRTFLKDLGKVSIFLSLAPSLMPMVSRGASILSGGLGTASMSGTDENPGTPEIEVLACSYVTWIITYTAGADDIQPGGGLHIYLYSHPVRKGAWQTTDPARQGYVTAATNGSSSLECEVTTRDIYVTVRDAPLTEGEKIFLTVGDASAGGPGWRMRVSAGGPVPPIWPEELWDIQYLQRRFHVSAFGVSVDVNGNGDFENLVEPYLFMWVLHLLASRMTVLSPSQTIAGQSFSTVVRMEDKYGNLVEDFEGVSPCFSASTAVAGLVQLVRNGAIPSDHCVLVNLTGADRDPHPMPRNVQWLDRTPFGWKPTESGSFA